MHFCPSWGTTTRIHAFDRNLSTACFYTFTKGMNQIILNWALFAWKHITQQHRQAWYLKSRAGSKDCSEMSLESPVSWTSVYLHWLFMTRTLRPNNLVLGSSASNQPQPRNSTRDTSVLVPFLESPFLSTAALSTRLWPGVLHSTTPQAWAKADLSLRGECGGVLWG